MRNRHNPLGPSALLACITLLASLGAVAAPPAPATSRPAAEPCIQGRTPSGGVGCISPAEANLTRSRQAALDKDPAQYQRNALVRCDRLVGDDRQDCVARIQGQGTTSGSVENGGIYRELVTRSVGTPAPVAQPAPPQLPDDKRPDDKKP
jgi:hypothetical protein